ncbi:MAG: serine/threonine protein kinase [Candidatus Obscuribacterales bacterium]|nr:serine/threonine protein kinase [Candidatus Obscuribacterales bacterium]
MFDKWIKRSKEPKPKLQPSTSKIEKASGAEAASTNITAVPIGKSSPVTINFQRIKACPMCNTEYLNNNLVVCPKDRTMLLTPEIPNDWFDWREAAQSCPQCSALYYHFLSPTCPRDGEKLVPLGENPFDPPVLEGRFKLIGFVEKGDIFEEYEALDLGTDISVRLKIMGRHLGCDSRTVTNFFRYSRPAVGLRHDNIITAITINSTEEGLPYLITDNIPSRTLYQEFQKEKVFSPVYTRLVFTDFLKGIQHAHDSGIVHGAITMHHLFLEGDSDQPKGYVSNFGIAERLFRELDWTVASTDTHTANVYGDPTGMCPEFCKGKRPTPASDIYQLGCCLYQCLSGQVPFDRETLPMILIAHMTDPPDDIRKKNPQISAGLAAIVNRCLSKEPSDRFPSALALSQALASEVAG